ncbi:hypothetical protein D3C87_1840890 [compost metagenome]
MCVKTRQTGRHGGDLIGKGVHIAVFSRVEPVNLSAMFCLSKRVQHRQHGRLADTCGDERNRRIGVNSHKEIPRRGGKMNFIAHYGVVMQPA